MHIVGVSKSGNYQKAFYLKNNQFVNLTKKADDNAAIDIKVINGNAYILGFDFNYCYCVNGIGVYNSNATPNLSNIIDVTSIFVKP